MSAADTLQESETAASVSTQADTGDWIKWFNELSIDDVLIVCGKNASLGEMYRELNSEGVRVPNGFAVTADAYRAQTHSAKLSESSFELAGIGALPLNASPFQIENPQHEQEFRHQPYLGSMRRSRSGVAGAMAHAGDDDGHVRTLRRADQLGRRAHAV